MSNMQAGSKNYCKNETVEKVIVSLHLVQKITSTKIVLVSYGEDFLCLRGDKHSLTDVSFSLIPPSAVLRSSRSFGFAETCFPFRAVKQTWTLPANIGTNTQASAERAANLLSGGRDCLQWLH